MRSSVANDVISRARSLVDTPYHHQGRRPGVGIDCIGVVVVIAKRRGYFSYDDTNYGRDPFDDRLERGLARFFTPVPFVRNQQPEPGAVLWFVHPKTERNHVAIATYTGMIHAESLMGRGRVVEQPIGAKWHRNLKGVYLWDK